MKFYKVSDNQFVNVDKIISIYLKYDEGFWCVIIETDGRSYILSELDSKPEASNFLNKILLDIEKGGIK